MGSSAGRRKIGGMVMGKRHATPKPQEWRNSEEREKIGGEAWCVKPHAEIMHIGGKNNVRSYVHERKMFVRIVVPTSS